MNCAAVIAEIPHVWNVIGRVRTGQCRWIVLTLFDLFCVGFASRLIGGFGRGVVPEPITPAGDGDDLGWLLRSCSLWYKIREEIKYRKRLKELKKKDPFIYK